MERNIKGLLAFGLVVMFLAVCSHSVLAITCGEAIVQLLPCQPYLVGLDGQPSPACCAAVASLNDLAVGDPAACKDICSCIKIAAQSFGVIADKAKQLPNLCHVDVVVPIDPAIDCTNIVCKKPSA